MSISFTIFHSIYDNRTHKRMDLSCYDEFVDLLAALSKERGYKPKAGERTKKKGSPLISPAIYKQGTTRANASVTAWGGWAAIDVDDYDGTPEEAMSVFNGVEHVRYSSASSTKEHPKFRVVLPLTRHVENSQIRHLWYAINKEFNSLGDPQTKDLSRMYYVPAKYPGSFTFFERVAGRIIDPSELMKRHEYVPPATSFLDSLPEHLREEALRHRMSRLTNKTRNWTGTGDCPYLSKKSIAEYHSICGTGWYKKMYSIMTGIATSAIRDKYPITARELATLAREINDSNAVTRERYKRRNWELEASRAIEYALKVT